VLFCEPLLYLGLQGALEGLGTLEESRSAFGEVLVFVRERAMTFAKNNPYFVFLAAWGLLRALGTTVRTGETGLFFSLGRAKRVLEPGFVFKIPYFQSVRTLPTRSRTMDVPNQKVTSADGLVWFVDVNLVYRIVDIQKALIEVEDLLKGMRQMLSLSVQEIVCSSKRSAMRLAGELDGELTRAMEARLEPWGVVVEHTGFISIKPSPRTLRITQQAHASMERRDNLRLLERGGIEEPLALALLGTPRKFIRREVAAIARESRSRRRRRILSAVRRTVKVYEGDKLNSPITPVQYTEMRQRAVRHLA